MDDVIVLSDSDESIEESNNKNKKRNIDSPSTKSSNSESVDNILHGKCRSKRKHKKLDLNESDEEIYNLIYNPTEKQSNPSDTSTTNTQSKLSSKDKEEKECSDSDISDTGIIRRNSQPNDTDLSDFEFPDISLEIKKNINTKNSKEKVECDLDFPDTDIYIREISEVDSKDRKPRELDDFNSPDAQDDILNLQDINDSDSERNILNKKNNVNKPHNKDSESDSDYESQNQPVNYYQKLKEKRKATHVNLDSSEEDNDWFATDNNKKSKAKTTKSKKVTNEEKKRLQEEKRLQKEAEKLKKEEEKLRKKEEREQERIRKQNELAKQKALKQMNSKNRLNFNADYSMKLMKVVFDDELENSDFFSEFIKTTEESEVTYDVQSQIIPKSITWTRKVEENYVNDRNQVCSNSRIVEENHSIIIWDCKETIQHVANSTLTTTISNIKSLLGSKQIYLVLYKVDDYFKFSKNKKDRNVRQEILGEAEQSKKSKNKFDKTYADLPTISKKNLERYLIEVQLLYNISSRLIENEIEMVLLINQYTKSLALLPSKLEKRKDSKLDWYVNCDNRDTVKVDKDGNGLKRYWQQQLCQFNLTSLETSEAITSVYKSPLDLMEAYEKCTPAEGELLLRDIPIRRAAGQLTSIRKIGPELSKKIYLMFTTENGEIYLNDTNE